MQCLYRCSVLDSIIHSNNRAKGPEGSAALGLVGAVPGYFCCLFNNGSPIAPTFLFAALGAAGLVILASLIKAAMGKTKEG